MTAAAHIFPKAPLPKSTVTPAACSKTVPCAMLRLAIDGSKGSDVGLVESFVFDGDGSGARLALRIRVENPTHKSRKKWLSVFVEFCPFCGRKAPWL